MLYISIALAAYTLQRVEWCVPLTCPHHMTDHGSRVHEDRMRGQWARWYLYPPSVGIADTVNPVRKRTLHSVSCERRNETRYAVR